MQDKIFEIICKCLKDIDEELDIPIFKNITKDTVIFGDENSLDSLMLVSLIADIEDRVSQELSKDIVLADEKAMSLKTSPFRKVETLQNYIIELLQN